MVYFRNAFHTSTTVLAANTHQATLVAIDIACIHCSALMARLTAVKVVRIDA
jgi:hypothetical protein